jgi:hypothetical protein
MNLKDLRADAGSLHLTLSSTARGGFYFMVLLGLAAFAGAVVSGEPARAWGSLLFNLMLLFSMSLGGVCLGHMQDVIGATWGRPVKRLHESFGAFVPVSVGLFLLFFASIKLRLFGAHQVYSWIDNPALIAGFKGKNFWLQENFMLARDSLALLSILGLVRWHKRLTHAADASVISGDFKQARELGEKARATLRYWSAPALLAHALLYSLVTFDLTMSLAPTWFSTLWAGWSFSVMMQTLFATILLFLFALKKHTLGRYIQQAQFHDIGKLMFGFTAFYAYLTYAHVLTYWYTNIPEETSYFLLRMNEPWFTYIKISPFISFLLPFVVMIPRPSKWTSVIAIPSATLILIAQWLNYMLVVQPEVVKAGQTFVPWVELGGLSMMLGLFFLAFFRFTTQHTILGIGDPLLPESYAHH